MKNKLVLLAVCCVVGLSLTGCDNDTSGTTPVANSVRTFGSRDDLDNEIEKTSFATVSQNIFLDVRVYDPDLDVKTIYITLTQVGGSSELLYAEYSSMPAANTSYPIVVETSKLSSFTAGTWVISAYAVDSKGNTSNTVSCMITVSS